MSRIKINNAPSHAAPVSPLDTGSEGARVERIRFKPFVVEGRIPPKDRLSAILSKLKKTSPSKLAVFVGGVRKEQRQLALARILDICVRVGQATGHAPELVLVRNDPKTGHAVISKYGIMNMKGRAALVDGLSGIDHSGTTPRIETAAKKINADLIVSIGHGPEEDHEPDSFLSIPKTDNFEVTLMDFAGTGRVSWFAVIERLKDALSAYGEVHGETGLRKFSKTFDASERLLVYAADSVLEPGENEVARIKKLHDNTVKSEPAGDPAKDHLVSSMECASTESGCRVLLTSRLFYLGLIPEIIGTGDIWADAAGRVFTSSVIRDFDPADARSNKRPPIDNLLAFSGMDEKSIATHIIEGNEFDGFLSRDEGIFLPDTRGLEKIVTGEAEDVKAHILEKLEAKIEKDPFAGAICLSLFSHISDIKNSARLRHLLKTALPRKLAHSAKFSDTTCNRLMTALHFLANAGILERGDIADICKVAFVSRTKRGFLGVRYAKQFGDIFRTTFKENEYDLVLIHLMETALKMNIGEYDDLFLSFFNPIYMDVNWALNLWERVYNKDGLFAAYLRKFPHYIKQSPLERDLQSVIHIEELMCKNGSGILATVGNQRYFQKTVKLRLELGLLDKHFLSVSARELNRELSIYPGQDLPRCFGQHNGLLNNEEPEKIKKGYLESRVKGISIFEMNYDFKDYLEVVKDAESHRCWRDPKVRTAFLKSFLKNHPVGYVQAIFQRERDEPDLNMLIPMLMTLNDTINEEMKDNRRDIGIFWHTKILLSVYAALSDDAVWRLQNPWNVILGKYDGVRDWRVRMIEDITPIAKACLKNILRTILDGYEREDLVKTLDSIIKVPYDTMNGAIIIESIEKLAK